MPENLGLAMLGIHACVLIGKLLREKEKREMQYANSHKKMCFFGIDKIKEKS